MLRDKLKDLYVSMSKASSDDDNLRLGLQLEEAKNTGQVLIDGEHPTY